MYNNRSASETKERVHGASVRSADPQHAILRMFTDEGWRSKTMALDSDINPVITELRELKADIYKLGRSLDGGSFAGPRAVLPSTEAPCYERAARSPRCSLHNSQDSTKNRKSACRSGNDRKASSVPPKPPPPSPLPFSIPCRPSTTSLKQAVRSDYAGASDVSQLVQRVEKSARAVSREKEDVMEALRAEEGETARLREALKQASGVERQWKELIEESHTLKRRLESTERIRLRQKELISELQAAEADVAFAVATGVTALSPRMVTSAPPHPTASVPPPRKPLLSPRLARATGRSHAKSSARMHRGAGRRGQVSLGREPVGVLKTMAESRGTLGLERRRRQSSQSDGCISRPNRAGFNSSEGVESTRLPPPSVERRDEAGKVVSAPPRTSARKKSHTRSSVRLARCHFPGRKSKNEKNVEVAVARTGEKVSGKKLNAKHQRGDDALCGKVLNRARRSRPSAVRVGISTSSATTSWTQRPTEVMGRSSDGRSVGRLETQDKIRRTPRRPPKVKVRRSSRRGEAGFYAPTASSSGKVRSWVDTVDGYKLSR